MIGGNKTMKRLLIIGSTCVDVILRLDHLPTTGEDMHPTQRFAMGGCAYNVAQVPKAYDVDLTFVTPMGDHGVFSDFVRSHLANAGFRGPITVPDSENGCCYCLVEQSGERTFLSVHGIEYSFHADYMKNFAEEHFDYTYICGLEVEEPTGEELIAWLEAHPEIAGTVVYAPGPRGIAVAAERTARLFALHPILHLNEQETLALAAAHLSDVPTGEHASVSMDTTSFSSIERSATMDQRTVTWDAPVSKGTSACRNAPAGYSDAHTPTVSTAPASALSDRPLLSAAQTLHATTQNLVIVTRGAQGVLWISRDGSIHTLPAVPSTVVDTIGAGDSHCGAVLTGIALGWDEEHTLRFANQVASEVVAQEGGAYIRRK